MIVKTFNEQVREFFDGREIVSVYKGLQLVWSAIRSCFGKGFWINDKPWVNNDAWKNN